MRQEYFVVVIVVVLVINCSDGYFKGTLIPYQPLSKLLLKKGSQVGLMRPPGGPTTADMFCAYCMSIMWYDCILRFCYGDVVIPWGPPPVFQPVWQRQFALSKGGRIVKH